MVYALAQIKFSDLIREGKTRKDMLTYTKIYESTMTIFSPQLFTKLADGVHHHTHFGFGLVNRPGF